LHRFKKGIGYSIDGGFAEYARIPKHILKVGGLGHSSGQVDLKSIANILDFTNGMGANVVIIATSDPAAFDFALKVASKN
jgi:threonine dehydrogenase-like Zn-dependent dehydrogenase